jgi:uncharacterized protein
MDPIHPCQKCGACCSIYRVSFHWSETLKDSYHVPADMTVKVSPHMTALKYQNPDNMRCKALEGKIGKSVGCKIYDRRPSPCRNFTASFEDGTKNLRCDEARAKMGLLPLTSEDWPLSV